LGGDWNVRQEVKNLARGHTLYRFIDRIKLRWILGLFVVGVFAFAVGYDVAGTAGNGLIATYGSQKIGFIDCLYFSTITITSLGYGDLRPVGYGRLMAACEVVYGLTVIGIAIAKLASERQGFLLKSIYGGDHRDRILRMRESFNNSTKDIAAALSSNPIDLEAIEGAIEINWAITRGIRNYFGFEIYHGDLLEAVSNRTFQKLVISMTRFLRVGDGIGAVTGLSKEAKESLKYQMRLSEEIAKMLQFNSHNQRLNKLCDLLFEEVRNQRKLRTALRLHLSETDSLEA
jgi:hypothetical protein